MSDTTVQWIYTSLFMYWADYVLRAESISLNVQAAELKLYGIRNPIQKWHSDAAIIDHCIAWAVLILVHYHDVFLLQCQHFDLHSVLRRISHLPWCPKTSVLKMHKSEDWKYFSTLAIIFKNSTSSMEGHQWQKQWQWILFTIEVVNKMCKFEIVWWT